MQIVHRYRIPALICALAVLLCELIAHPFANMGVCDDGPYIVMARTLAATGHVAYTGWAAPMLGWQVYLGAAFVKFFGFSFTTVRMSTLFVSVLMAVVMQRTLVCAGISERNAAIGTLALVLCPLYLLLTATYMTDIFGLFAIITCLYGCFRARQSTTARSAIAWVCSAVITNAILGTSRQIAWLGILVMMPSLLWLMRAQRRVLIAGTAVTLAGVLFILACMHWLKLQPYSIPERILPENFPLGIIFTNIVQVFLELPFLLLPIIAIFIPRIFSNNRRSILVVVSVILAYTALGFQRGYIPLLEPAMGDWVTVFGTIHERGTLGDPPVLLHTSFRVFLAIASLGGLLGFAVSFLTSRPNRQHAESLKLSWRQLGVLLVPFTVAYTLLLVPRAASVGISDRYVIGLAFPALLCLVRYYQDRFGPRLPLASVLMVGIMAILGIIMTRNTFAFYRARVAIAEEIRAAGVPDTSTDNGWEHNFDVELQHADHLNFPTIVVPANAYVPRPPIPAGACFMPLYDVTPHITPLYTTSFDPNACYGPAPFAPVHYTRWPFQVPGTLYVVRSLPATKP
jgi:hypothetical protein